MIHLIAAQAHPEFPDCTHEIEVWDINISLKNQEVALVTSSLIKDKDGKLMARTEAKTVILRATMDTYVNTAGNFVDGPADGKKVFPEFMAIFSQAFPMLLPFVEKGVDNGVEQGRYW